MNDKKESENETAINDNKSHGTNHFVWTTSSAQFDTQQQLLEFFIFISNSYRWFGWLGFSFELILEWNGLNILS